MNAMMRIHGGKNFNMKFSNILLTLLIISDYNRIQKSIIFDKL